MVVAPRPMIWVPRRKYSTFIRPGRPSRTSSGSAANGSWRARKSRISASSTSRAMGSSSQLAAKAPQRALTCCNEDTRRRSAPRRRVGTMRENPTEGPADSGAGEPAVPGEHDGGADGGAGTEGPADSGAGDTRTGRGRRRCRRWRRGSVRQRGRRAGRPRRARRRRRRRRRLLAVTDPISPEPPSRPLRRAGPGARGGGRPPRAVRRHPLGTGAPAEPRPTRPRRPTASAPTRSTSCSPAGGCAPRSPDGARRRHLDPREFTLAAGSVPRSRPGERGQGAPAVRGRRDIVLQGLHRSWAPVGAPPGT